MIIKIIHETIGLDELREIAKEFYIEMIKGVVDIEQEIVAFGGEWHADANNELLSINTDSKQENIWGFNIYFDRPRDSWIEYNSMINIRPQANNRSMEVEDEKIRKEIARIVNQKIK